MAKRPRVALLIESSRGYGRGVLHGIAEYVRVNGPWSIYLEGRRLGDAPPAWLEHWDGDGIIARVENQPIARAIRARRVPAVDLMGRLNHLRMPTILTDDDAVTRLAAEHLLERGFRQFAYCGFVGAKYSDERSGFFTRLINAAGFECHTYRPPESFRDEDTERTEQLGLIHEQDVIPWLRKLPKPIGLMACNDIRGQQVLNLCREISITVPDEVAVVGVDNDDVLCDLCDPPLSSVVPNTRRIGYEAAALLDRLMAGEPPPRETLFIQPLGLVTRRSTDVLAIEDRDTAAAVRFIRDHACDGIKVADVVAQVPLSHKALERRFLKLLGHTLKAEILRVQLDRVKQLLVETEFSQKQIAARAGFKHTEYLSVIFKEKTGQTPGQYRTVAQQRKLMKRAP
jgi:LacI family transcriptional regulator